MKNNDYKIGIFDSGIGGLTILNQLKDFNKGRIIYLGDNINAPFGNKDKKELLDIIYKIIKRLKEEKVDIYINACNSLSTLEINNILEDLSIEKNNYFDMVSAINKNIEKILNKKETILIFGTIATINSGAYQKILNDRYNVQTISSQYLAKAIEEGDDSRIKEEINILSNTLTKNKINNLLLACTHYPLIIDEMKKDFENKNIKINIIDPSIFIKMEVENIFINNNNSLFVDFYWTDRNKKYNESYFYNYQHKMNYIQL